MGDARKRQSEMPIPSRQRLSLRLWMSVLLLGVSTWLLITHIALVWEIMWVLFGALLLSVAIAPIVNVLAGWHVPRGLGVVLIFVGVLGILALIGYLLDPIISREVTRLEATGPALLQQALSVLASTPVIQRLLPSSSTLIQQLTQRVTALLGTLVSALSSLESLLLDLVLVLVLIFIFVTDADIFEGLVNRWIPSRHQRRVRRVAGPLGRRLARWVWVQIARGAFFAAFFSLGLALLHVPFSYTIGLVGGILELAPYLSFIALLVAAVSALTIHPIYALWVVLIYVVVVEIENHVLAPVLYGSATGIRPSIALVALVVGIKFAGVVGALFAIPVAVVLAVVLEELLRNWPEPEAQVEMPEAKEQP
jgi:predicted PurR-regulated permease PerM